MNYILYILFVIAIISGVMNGIQELSPVWRLNTPASNRLWDFLFFNKY